MVLMLTCLLHSQASAQTVLCGSSNIHVDDLPCYLGCIQFCEMPMRVISLVKSCLFVMLSVVCILYTGMYPSTCMLELAESIRMFHASYDCDQFKTVFCHHGAVLPLPSVVGCCQSKNRPGVSSTSLYSQRCLWLYTGCIAIDIKQGREWCSQARVPQIRTYSPSEFVIC